MATTNIKFGLLFVALTAFTMAQAQAAIVWRSALDGNAVAIVGNDGVATGTPTATTDKNGNVGGAVDFSGGNSYFEIDANPEITSLSAGTISAWIKWNNTGGEQGAVAVGASGGGQTEYFTFMRQTQAVVRTDLDDGDDGIGRRDASAAGLSVDTWYHVAATFTAGGTLSLYIDGVLADTGSLAGGEASIDGLNTWLIGTERTNERFLDGALDDVRIYDNELTTSEVLALSNNGPQFVPEPSTYAVFGGLMLCFGIAGWWRKRRGQAA